MDHHLLAIRVFNRVVETGGFTRAADSLGMPKATVTKLIQSTEDHLQTKLFQRTTRSVSVTREGECYYQNTVKWLADLEQMEGCLTESQSSPQGVLRIDTGGGTARRLLLPALPDFLARYPQIQIDLSVGDRVIDLISDSTDCVIRSGPLADSSLIARRLFDLDWVSCATGLRRATARRATRAIWSRAFQWCTIATRSTTAFTRNAMSSAAKRSPSSNAIRSASTKATPCWRRARRIGHHPDLSLYGAAAPRQR